MYVFHIITIIFGYNFVPLSKWSDNFVTSEFFNSVSTGSGCYCDASWYIYFLAVRIRDYSDFKALPLQIKDLFNICDNIFYL